MSDSLWFTTRSALFRPGDQAWNEIAAYAEPLRRLLGRRYRVLSEADRDDLAQEVLLEMRRSLVEVHDPGRGRFRALLQTVVKRRVIDRLRARRDARLDPAVEDGLEAPTEEDVSALDLETAVLSAVAACRDRFTQGPHKDPEVLYALADRLVHGRSNQEIAATGGVSKDRVARLLRRGRDAIFRHLLARELDREDDDRALDRALEVFKLQLRQPGEAARLLETVADDELRERLGDFLARFQRALPRLHGDGTAAGDELRRGLDLVIFGEPR